MNVGSATAADMRWGYPYPVVLPVLLDRRLWNRGDDDQVTSAIGAAEQRAAGVADDALLDEATAIVDVGEPATTILAASHEHGADVIVVGSHERSWFSRLFTPSVEREVVKDAGCPVLVVKSRS